MQQNQTVIEIGEYSFFPEQVLGKGATGLVFKGFRKMDKMPVAIKSVKLEEINTPLKNHLLNCEVKAVSTIKDKNVCEAYKVMKDKDHYYFALEYCSGGTLKDYIRRKRSLSETEVLSLFSKIVDGYCAIKKSGYLHRDLKPDNILLRKNLEPAIIDFGYAEKESTQRQELLYNVGSPAYMAPESYLSNYYSEKSDIWSLGVTLYEMLTGTIPILQAKDIEEYFLQLREKESAEITHKFEKQTTFTILKACLTVDMNKRVSVDALRILCGNISSKKRIQFVHMDQQNTNFSQQGVVNYSRTPTHRHNQSFFSGKHNQNCEWGSQSTNLRQNPCQYGQYGQRNSLKHHFAGGERKMGKKQSIGYQSCFELPPLHSEMSEMAEGKGEILQNKPLNLQPSYFMRKEVPLRSH